VSDLVLDKVVLDAEPPALSIGELADMLGITTRTIRFYEDRGLLLPRRVGKTRVYGDRDRIRLQLILRGKRLGFSLAEIRDWLDLYDLEDGQRRQYEVLLTESRKRIAHLEQQRLDITTTLDELKTIEAFAMEQLVAAKIDIRNSRRTRRAATVHKGKM
jgi:DNA-binding transcriptional MerR regulator